MARFVGETNIDEPVQIDGHVYDSCTFTRCELQFGGSGPANMTNCKVFESRWVVVGASRDTLNFLQVMYNHGGPAGRALAELAIETTRAGNTDLGSMQIGGPQA